MERWIEIKQKGGENSKIDAFLEDVVSVCRKHGLSIEHEDAHGGFEVTKFNRDAVDWLLAASDCSER